MKIRRFKTEPISLTAEMILNYYYPPRRHHHEDGNPRSKSNLTEAAKAVAEMVSEVSPTGLLGLANEKDLREWRFSDSDLFAAIGLVTLGVEFDLRMNQFSQNGDMLMALLADAGGSLLVDMACDQLEQITVKEFVSAGVVPGPRISPGYGSFPLSEQMWLFERLPADQINVRLKSNYMMDPLKTISFIVLPKTNKILYPKRMDCGSCNILNCPDRNRTNKCKRWEESK
jgi:hypothetical protein